MVYIDFWAGWRMRVSDAELEGGSTSSVVFAVRSESRK